MSDIGYVRVFVPKQVKIGETIKIRAAITHPMEPVERDAQDRVIEKPYNYVHTMTVFFDEREVLRVSPGQSISANPVFAFTFKVLAPGTLRILFEDTRNGKYEGTRKIEPLG